MNVIGEYVIVQLCFNCIMPDLYIIILYGVSFDIILTWLSLKLKHFIFAGQ